MRASATILSLWIALTALSAGCAGASAARRGPTGGLVLHCDPPDATVYLDDEYRGSCALFARRALPLTEGTHRLQVDASGRFPYYGEIDAAGIRQTLEVRLVARPD